MSDTITIQLTVTAQAGSPRVPLQLAKSATCAELRTKVSEATNIPLDALKLIVRGRLIANDETKVAVTEFKLEDGSVLHCMGKPATAATSTTTSTAAAAPAAPTTVATGATITSAAPAAPAVNTASGTNSLTAALQRMRQLNSPAVFKTAVTTLKKMLDNIVKNPMEEKYRRVKKQNAAFGKRLGNIPGGGDSIMLAAGFTLKEHEGETVYFLEANPQAWPQLLQTQTAVNQAVQQAEAAATAPAAPVPVPAPMMGGMGNNPAGLPNDPAMQAMASNLLSNPAALQNMMRNPMVQQMMRNDPRFGPEMEQVVEQLANNPQMAERMGQMMQNPAMQAQMQQAMQAMQQQPNNSGGGAFPNFMPPGAQSNTNNAFPNFMPPGTQTNNNNNTFPNFMPPGTQANNNNNNSSASNNNNQNDNAATEEEMIAEAIRRSLQDNN